jgi:hypothetical protein
MSTSSAYSSNKLNQVINDNTQHFIILSYVTTVFEYNRKKSEYHLYWYNKNKGIDPDDINYKNLSYKKMNNKEIRFFQSIVNQYNLDLDYEDGKIWSHKQIGFNKDKVRNFIQLEIPILES